MECVDGQQNVRQLGATIILNAIEFVTANITVIVVADKYDYNLMYSNILSQITIPCKDQYRDIYLCHIISEI